MYAVFTEVNVPDGAPLDVARQTLQNTAVPMSRAAGATHGYWLAPQGGRGVGVVLFEDEESARKIAAQLDGNVAGDSHLPSGVSFRTVEVREVLAQL